METFFSFLEKRVDDCSSLLCIGLDPHVDDLPEQTAQAALEFCLKLVKATAPYAAAFKPNAAFFEVFGPEGWTALKQVIEAIQAESDRRGSKIPVILDAKRGDIASTAAAYAQSAFIGLGADAITLSPYLGQDSLAPFLEKTEKGAFVLCKTSNPGSGDLQDLVIGGNDGTLYEHVARLAQQWNTKGNLGLVVGATHLEALTKVRQAAPKLWFLVPGVGAQGGDLEAALRAGLRPDGKGLLINVSRSIARAANPGLAAAELRDQIVSIRAELDKERRTSTSAAAAVLDPARAALADGLLAAGCVKFGQFTLKSGLLSPIYLDLRELVTYPAVLRLAARAFLPLLKPLEFKRLAALPYAALPIGTAVSLEGDWAMIYPRKEVKVYGTKADIEGHYEPGEQVVVIDDLATTGGSKFEAIEKLTGAGLQVKDVVVLVDRQSGAKEALAEAGFALHAVLTLTEMLDYWESTGSVPLEKIIETRSFLKL